MKTVNATTVTQLFAEMKKAYGTHYVDKRNADEMRIVANFLDQIGVMDKGKFLERCATTIGHKIYLPFTPGGENFLLISQVLICAHEHQHVVVMEREGAALYNTLYVLSPSIRALYEAECYRADMEVFWWYSRAVLGKAHLLSPASLAVQLHSYGCSEKDIAVAKVSLEKAAEVVRMGGVSCRAAQNVIRFFGWNTEAPMRAVHNLADVPKKVARGKVEKKAPKKAVKKAPARAAKKARKS